MGILVFSLWIVVPRYFGAACEIWCKHTSSLLSYSLMFSLHGALGSQYITQQQEKSGIYQESGIYPLSPRYSAGGPQANSGSWGAFLWPQYRERKTFCLLGVVFLDWHREGDNVCPLGVGRGFTWFSKCTRIIHLTFNKLEHQNYLK